MKKSEKKFDQDAYTKEYQTKNYYRMTVLMPKDMRKKIEEEAERLGESKNGFVVQAIQEKLSRER